MAYISQDELEVINTKPIENELFQGFRVMFKAAFANTEVTDSKDLESRLLSGDGISQRHPFQYMTDKF